ncbi:MAG: hypothetical protein ABEJ79_01485 [Halolamina sp.]
MSRDEADQRPPDETETDTEADNGTGRADADARRGDDAEADETRVDRATDIDPIADSLLSDDSYRRRRVERTGGFSWDTPRRLQLQAAVLAALALTYPLSAVAPAVGSAPVALYLGAFGGVVETVGACITGWVGLVRVRADDVVSEETANSLVTLEDLATLLGLVTGVLSVAATLALFVGGALAPAAVAGALDGDPFAQTARPLTVAGVAGVAVVVSAAVFAASRWLDGRLR